MIAIKRVYDSPQKGDGYRILVDRLWPRGLSKEKASIDLWLKEIAPSNDLRKWFGHDPARYDEFKKRYESELAGSPALDEMKKLMRDHPHITAVYGAHDPEHNNAVVLLEFLSK